MKPEKELVVRPAARADIAAITSIYAHAVAHGVASFELTPPNEAEMTRRFEAIASAGYPYLVAERGGEILGYAYLSAYRSRPAYKSTVENSIYVSPKAQRLGTGRILLAELISKAESLGYRQIIAVIGDSANSPSINLHRAMGFTFAGTLHSVGFKHGRWLDSVLMQLAVGEGDSTAPTIVPKA
ncbi:MAG: N-acetyltransferase [Hyphomicrobiaceae bacterium]|nr:MAG: N-acetyltransferase [Hyphomicrobiaceae bacterium]